MLQFNKKLMATQYNSIINMYNRKLNNTTTKNYKIRVIINIKYLFMYLTVLSHFNIERVNTLGDICNE
jgi:hypothetical protein